MVQENLLSYAMTFLDLILSNGVAEFFPANSQFLIYFGPNFFLQLVNPILDGGGGQICPPAGFLNIA